jgi:hypothetical protein
MRATTSLFVVVGYDANGEEIKRWELSATDPAEACTIAERNVAGQMTVEEFQAVTRLISNDEIISRDYTTLDSVDVCTSCGRQGWGFYFPRDTERAEAQCIQCLHSALNHGRKHVPEAFAEELLPVCNFCLTPGHLAAHCPEQPDVEACPGCGCIPGDGVTTGCTHPAGCGFYTAEGGAL